MSNEVAIIDEIRLEDKIYFVRNKAKVSLGLCQGKKLYDKRESIKERDIRRKEYINY